MICLLQGIIFISEIITCRVQKSTCVFFTAAIFCQHYVKMPIKNPNLKVLLQIEYVNLQHFKLSFTVEWLLTTPPVIFNRLLQYLLIHYQ